MSANKYQSDIVQAAEQLFQTSDLMAFQDDMVNVVETNITEGYLQGADEVLPPEPERPPIIQTLYEVKPEEEKKIPESARIALLALLALNMGYISSLGIYVLNKRSSYDATILGLDNAALYLRSDNIPLAIYNLKYAERSAVGIGANIVGGIAKIVTSVQNGTTSISMAVQASTEQIHYTIAKNIIGKSDLWGNGYLGAMNLGRLLAAPDETHLKWNLGEREHCGSCLKLAGKVKTAEYWRDAGVGPQAGPYGSLPNTKLDCKGYHCGCFFTVTDDNLSPGDLPMLP